ncbi:MAG: NAD(P)H-dependent oxidoreductase [Patescibacteria group bacterium]
MSKKIFLLLGHPDTRGMCGQLADAYEEGAKEGKHELVRMNIGEMQFDPILHKGYREIQELEPALKEFQKNIQWADHFVVIHPVWWVGMPAGLKGLFDRAWLPGSAFRYIKTQTGERTIFWHRLFRGKTARIIVTSGTAPWLVRFLPGNVNAQLRWGILWFAGFSVRTTWYGPAENVPEERKHKWLGNIHALGRRGV